MYNSTIYYNLKRSIYRDRWSINIITEKIRLVFCTNLPCPFSSYLGFRFISSSQLYILKCVHGICYKQYTFNLTKKIILISYPILTTKTQCSLSIHQLFTHWDLTQTGPGAKREKELRTFSNFHQLHFKSYAYCTKLW